MDNGVLIATISMIGSLVTGGFLMWQQFNKDAVTARIENKKIDADNNIELTRLKKEIETDLWDKMKVEFTSMRDLIKSLETDKKNLSTRVDELELLVDTLTNDKRELSATVSSQGSMMIQMKGQIESLQLDRDHWQKRAIEAEGKPKGKMNL